MEAASETSSPALKVQARHSITSATALMLTFSFFLCSSATADQSLADLRETPGNRASAAGLFVAASKPSGTENDVPHPESQADVGDEDTEEDCS